MSVPMPDDRPESPEERQPRKLAQEVRGILRASAYFDPTARIYSLVNALESFGLSVETERDDLRAAFSTPAGPSPEPILKDKSKMTPEDVARYNHDPAPSPREEAVEAAAKAMYESGGEGPAGPYEWATLPNENRETWRKLARAALSAARPSSPEEEIERRLRASLERYGRHEDGCLAGHKLTGAPARCTCGYHAALNWFPTPGDDATTKEGR